MKKSHFVIIGADSGIGLGLLHHLVEAGHNVTATAKDDMGKTQLQILFPSHDIHCLDLCEEEHIIRFCASISTIDLLDGIILNAGVAVGGPVSHLDIRELKRLFDINVFGQLDILQKVLPKLERSASPRIVWTGSAAGYFVRPLLGGYASSKFAVTALLDALRVELSGRIYVSHIAPGRIKTSIWSNGAEQANVLASKSGLESYTSAIMQLKKEAEDNAKDAPPVDWVVNAMDHALFSKKPKAMYRIGPDAKLAYWLKWLLPQSWIDRLLRRLCW